MIALSANKMLSAVLLLGVCVAGCIHSTMSGNSVKSGAASQNGSQASERLALYTHQSDWGGDCKKTLSRQSPIKLDSAAPSLIRNSPNKRVIFNYSPSEVAADIVDAGHTMRVDFPPTEKSSVTYNGKVYHVSQLHFHTPAEHVVDGKQAAAEMHIVHKRRDSDTSDVNVALALGLLLDVGAVTTPTDQAVDAILQALVKHQAAVREVHKEEAASLALGQHASLHSELDEVDPRSLRGIDEKLALGSTAHAEVNLLKAGEIFQVKFEDIIPPQTSFIIYNGSLTTEPCSEVVVHAVSQTHATISKTAFDALQSVYPGTNRDLQQLGKVEVRELAKFSK